ncbi:MAG: M67 family metallopeptidase [Anaerolineales bacterium]
MIQQLIISKEYREAILAHVERELPNEACGLLAGKNDRVEKVFLIPNQVQSPVRFVMDPYEQLQAFEWIDSHGLTLLGIFHSHPTGPETVSATDIAEAAYDVVHIVCSRNDGGWKIRGFSIENGKAAEITLLLTDR